VTAPQSTFERRRIAPAHWWGRAENARLSAAAMWQLQDGGDFARTLSASVAYGGSPSIAYREAFMREAAIALELIIKAVIAQRLVTRCADPATEGVPPNHFLPTLWGMAGLMKLGREDRYRLLRFESVLIWSGRYAAPRTEKAWMETGKRKVHGTESASGQGRAAAHHPPNSLWLA